MTDVSTSKKLFETEKKKEELYNINYDAYKSRGGSFLFVPFGKGDVFSREDFTEDQKMFLAAAEEFAVKRMEPISKDLNIYNKDLTLKIFKEMGDLGFTGIDIPEEFGGLGLDKTTAGIVAEVLSKCKSASMMTTFSAHVGIATLPIIWYGNNQQKEKYLPKMASGEWMGSFALTEPSAGSDAMGGTATAKLNEDGKHYILNGQKIYVTNGSWSEVCVTFAKVEGKYTAFIIDRGCEGYVIGEEEKKMGIKASSTVPLYFENCKVPIENVLGEVGQGGPIAFNVLYTGRYKLGVTTVAGAKYTISSALDYANEREQFSRPISDFDMIKKKFANMVTRTWEGDSVNYMICGSIDMEISKLDKTQDDYYLHVQKIIEDHAIEASICKIIGSETLAYVVDESVQVLGGAGFIEEYGMAGVYRDERINRIFEGTNEINRLLISSITLKKAILEELPLRDAISMRYKNWLNEVSENNNLSERIIENVVTYCRSASLFVLNELILKYGQDMKNHQWVLEPFANMLSALCIVDTGLKRVAKIDDKVKSVENMEVLKLSICQQYNNLNTEMNKILSHIYRGDDLQNMNKMIEEYKRKLDYFPDEISLMNKVADRLYKNGKYYLD